jgi:peptide/nickel transport system permease protein
MAVLATLIVFLISNVVPGDPVLAQLGDVAASDPATVAQWRAKWGMDLPIWDRYEIFLSGLVRGDLGISIATRRPVLDDIEQYAPATVELATVSFVLSIIVGIPLGIAAAVKRDSWVDSLARAISLLGVSAPTFWLAFIMMAIFYGGLEWAPGPGGWIRWRSRPRDQPGCSSSTVFGTVTGRPSATPPHIWCCPRSCWRREHLD